MFVWCSAEAEGAGSHAGAGGGVEEERSPAGGAHQEEGQTQHCFRNRVDGPYPAQRHVNISWLNTSIKDDKSRFNSLKQNNITLDTFPMDRIRANITLKLWPWSTKPVMRVSLFEIEIYASYESWVYNISVDVWFGQYLEIWGCKKIEILKKITFKVV